MTDHLAAVRKMARLVLNHLEAGHDLSNRKLVTDLTTLRRNTDKVLDLLGPPPSTDARISWLVRSFVRQEESLVSLATDISEAALELGSSAQAAATRVTDAIGVLRADLAAAITKIEELIAAGGADTAALTAALADVQAADAVVDSIEAAPAEPTPEESSARRPPPPSPSVP